MRNSKQDTRSCEDILSAPFTDVEFAVQEAGFYPSRVLPGANGRTVVCWTFGIACALPKADTIAFVVQAKNGPAIGLPASDSESTFRLVVVSWKNAVRVLGHRWERKFDRYCVQPHQFPDACEFRRLAALQIP